MIAKHRHLLSIPALFLLLSTTTAAANELKSQRNLFEIGLFLGALFPSDEHELYDPGTPHQPLRDAAFDVGARLGYIPIPYLGVELEMALMPTSTHTKKQDATLYAIRGHVVGQYPIGRVAPFVVAGIGTMGISSDDDALGGDNDYTFHWGIGAKYYATDWLALRVDARQDIGGRLGRGRVSHFEVLGGASFVLGWESEPPPPADMDGDGMPDRVDACPDQPADTPDGCPVKDGDGDGVPDDKDKCPEVAADAADGCPPDRDGDGVPDDKDKCPEQAAKTDDGCPPDRDGDGVPDDKDKCPDIPAKTADGCHGDKDGDSVLDDKDQCPEKPETKNGFQDADGCPDEVPQQVKKFTGTIKGITFASGKSVIKPASYQTLDQVTKLLADYPDLKLLIRGHTDNTGKKETNLTLSQARAQAVKDHLVKKGVKDDRLRVEGLGPDEPVADNKTAAGRAKNRRIEFKLD